MQLVSLVCAVFGIFFMSKALLTTSADVTDNNPSTVGNHHLDSKKNNGSSAPAPKLMDVEKKGKSKKKKPKKS